MEIGISWARSGLWITWQMCVWHISCRAVSRPLTLTVTVTSLRHCNWWCVLWFLTSHEHEWTDQQSKKWYFLIPNRWWHIWDITSINHIHITSLKQFSTMQHTLTQLKQSTSDVAITHITSDHITLTSITSHHMTSHRSGIIQIQRHDMIQHDSISHICDMTWHDTTLTTWYGITTWTIEASLTVEQDPKQPMRLDNQSYTDRNNRYHMASYEMALNYHIIPHHIARKPRDKITLNESRCSWWLLLMCGVAIGAVHREYCMCWL